MMFYRYINDVHEVFNVSTKLSAYGYIYYASLYAGESYAIWCLLALLALIGLGSTVVLITSHLCAILFAYRHLYKSVCRWTDHSFAAELQHPKRLCHNRSCVHPLRSILHYLKNTYRRCSHRLCCLRTLSNSGSGLLSPPVDTDGSSVIVRIPKLLEDGAPPAIDKSTSYPGVSIIKPLSGIDTNLEVNLTSYFCLDYPNYEILFCVADSADPCCDMVHRLQTSYPHIPSRLIIAYETVGVNPKVNNLQAGYDASRFDLLLVSDSGIWMRPDTLTDLVVTLNSDERIGLVHQVPFMTPRLIDGRGTGTDAPPKHLSSFYGIGNSKRPSFAWIVQLVFFGCWHAKIYLSAALFGINCVTGMSFLMRKHVLLPLGGFKTFGRYLAEDFFIAKYFLNQGWQVRLSHQPAWQNSPSASLSQFRSRINRWSQLRLSMVFLAYMLEPLSRCIPNALLGAFAFSYFFPHIVDPGVYFLCHVLIWFLLDYILLLLIYPTCVPLCITKFEYLVAWSFSELTAIPFHFFVLFRKELHWRNKRFRVRWGGLSEQIFPVPNTARIDLNCSSYDKEVTITESSGAYSLNCGNVSSISCVPASDPHRCSFPPYSHDDKRIHE